MELEKEIKDYSCKSCKSKEYEFKKDTGWQCPDCNKRLKEKMSSYWEDEGERKQKEEKSNKQRKKEKRGDKMSGNSIKETQDILIRYMIALGIDLSEKEEEMIYNCRDMEKLKKAIDRSFG